MHSKDVREALFKPGMLFSSVVDEDVLARLPADLFATMYLDDMRAYRFWSKGKPVCCESCQEVIPRATLLRRLYGNNYDPMCFAKVIALEEKKMSRDKRAYFARVVALDLDSQLDMFDEASISDLVRFR